MDLIEEEIRSAAARLGESCCSSESHFPVSIFDAVHSDHHVSIVTFRGRMDKFTIPDLIDRTHDRAKSSFALSNEVKRVSTIIVNDLELNVLSFLKLVAEVKVFREVGVKVIVLPLGPSKFYPLTQSLILHVNNANRVTL